VASDAGFSVTAHVLVSAKFIFEQVIHTTQAGRIGVGNATASEIGGKTDTAANSQKRLLRTRLAPGNARGKRVRTLMKPRLSAPVGDKIRAEHFVRLRPVCFYVSAHLPFKLQFEALLENKKDLLSVNTHERT
jgi:hypothetical protein